MTRERCNVRPQHTQVTFVILSVNFKNVHGSCRVHTVHHVTSVCLYENKISMYNYLAFPINCVYFINLMFLPSQGSCGACITAFDLLTGPWCYDGQVTQTRRRCHLSLTLSFTLSVSSLQNEGEKQLATWCHNRGLLCTLQGPGTIFNQVLVSVWAGSPIWTPTMSLTVRSEVWVTWWSFHSHHLSGNSWGVWVSWKRRWQGVKCSWRKAGRSEEEYFKDTTTIKISVLSSTDVFPALAKSPNLLFVVFQIK